MTIFLSNNFIWLSLVFALVSALVSNLFFPFVLRVARVRGLYDKPDQRKLQRAPVPVLGSPVIFAGFLVSILVLLSIKFSWNVVLMVGGMFILMLMGIMDDKRGLSPTLRLVMETLVVLALILASGNKIESFGGVFGCDVISSYISIPLSVIAGVGLINAINMIDGVDGYSSGYLMIASAFFGIVFLKSHIYQLGLTCFASMGSIFPFFLHNVFGKKTKMFIGDGGTMMLGVLLTSFLFSVCNANSDCSMLTEYYGISLIALCLSILAIPVGDTLRVMTARMLNGDSPFKADKTHLHHLFVDMGFSHFATSNAIFLMNGLVVLGWLMAWLLGAGMNGQLIAVIAVGVVLTIVFYPFMRKQQQRDTPIWRWMCRLGNKTHFENTSFWRWMQKFVDGDLFAEGASEKLNSTN